MEWKKRNESLDSLKDIVMSRVDEPEDLFFDYNKDYRLDGLDELSAMINGYTGPITIVNDYDVDGDCSGEILRRTLIKAGKKPRLITPRRFSEGYGLNPSIIDRIDDGLLITVDNGIAAHNAISKAKAKGLDVAVIDHHLPSADGLPPADIIIDPHAIEGQAEFNYYCGAGLAYKLASRMFPGEEMFLRQMRCLAAVATIADVVPLTYENRTIVRQGLKDMADPAYRIPGLDALFRAKAKTGEIQADDIGFMIGPMLNAPGRLYDDGASKVSELFACTDPIRAMELAAEINGDNEERKSQKKRGDEKAELILSSECLTRNRVMVLNIPGTGEGIIGIIAGNLAEKYKRPVLVCTESGKDPEVLKGSGRAGRDDVHLKHLMDTCPELFLGYGGHAGAAGFSVKKENLQVLNDALNEAAEKIGYSIDDADTVFYDLELNDRQIEKAIEEQDIYAPFGEGNPAPEYLIRNFRLIPTRNGFFKTMGDGSHLKLYGTEANAVCFGMTELFHDLGDPRTVDIIGRLSKNWSPSGSVENQIEVVAMRKAETAQTLSPFAMMLKERAAAL